MGREGGGFPSLPKIIKRGSNLASDETKRDTLQKKTELLEKTKSAEDFAIDQTTQQRRTIRGEITSTVAAHGASFGTRRRRDIFSSEIL